MDVSSVHQLCQKLISSAIQRCRMSDHLCRLSVFLKSSPPSDPPLVRISVSDTGVGSCLEEFQCLKYAMDPESAEKWGINDSDIYYYHLNLKEIVSTRRLTKLPSSSKNVSFSVFGSVDGLLVKLTYFLDKMLILRIPLQIVLSSLVILYQNVAIEMLVEESDDISGSRCKTLVPANDCFPLTSAASNVERLKSGLEDYVFKHGNNLNDICHSCFSSG
ncbi:hypothetical protein TEA_021489 [Camellia sinensis var. sinensis]|uniref:Uncharacterized protein n=1 Tax=Camellia sinensis var. sinensis TaxID=542762 RepID=A0A4S4D3Y1_CAMSN|nr:hypothetical protein TEA_021489 [Camellia sinensis var. sinensis]